MSTASKTTTTGRTAELEFDIDAKVEDVWAAITEADHLANWFPLSAKVEPGVNGTMLMSWGDEFNGQCRIEVWEPNKRLRYTFMDNVKEGDAPMRTFVDFYIGGDGGTTKLRLVHSGFGEGADWDQLYDSVSRGWGAELRSLCHYMANHFNVTREVAWAAVPFEKPDTEVWSLLMSDRCLGLKDVPSLKQGDKFSANGPVLGGVSGTVLMAEKPNAIILSIDELNNAFLRIELERCSGPEPSVWFWLSAYGIGGERRAALGSVIEKTVKELVA